MEQKKYVNEVVYMPPEMIASALEGTTRQYIQGDLQLEQKLPFIHNANCEIGITSYPTFDHDEPHYHDVITETNYVLSGAVVVRIVDTGEDFLVKEGGLFSVPPKITHILKAQPGTKILFVKDHALNDKRVVDLASLHLEQWLKDKEF